MIKPTIGRVVWFFPSITLMASLGLAFSDSSQPLAAMITYVWRDNLVNLVVYDQNGVPFNVTSVDLLEAGAEHQLSHHAEWMPYQQAQAKKDASEASHIAGHLNHSSDVLYPAIKAAMAELEEIDPLSSDTVNRAYNILHDAFWSETPAPADEAAKLRICSAPNPTQASD